MATGVTRAIQKAQRQDAVGSDFAGSDGETGRTLTLTNTKIIDTHTVAIDKQTLSSDEYSVSGGISSTLTITGILYDSQKVVILYWQ